MVLELVMHECRSSRPYNRTALVEVLATCRGDGVCVRLLRASSVPGGCQLEPDRNQTPCGGVFKSPSPPG